MRRHFLPTLLRLASLERGVFLWLPGVLLATALVLFGIRMAPSGVSLYTHTTSLRIVVGPWRGTNGAESAALVGALRRGLVGHGDLSLVDSLRVADRMRAVPGAAADADSFLYAIRPLNSHIGLRGTLLSASGAFDASLEAWDVHTRKRLLATLVHGSNPALLGAALADSVQAAVFLPRRVASIGR